MGLAIVNADSDLTGTTNISTGATSTPIADRTVGWAAYLLVGATLLIGVATLFRFPETVPFGCGYNSNVLPGLSLRLAAHVGGAASLALALWLRRSRRALDRALVIAGVAAGITGALAYVYYWFWASLSNELGVPDCGGLWAHAPARALIWAAPALAMALDVLTTVVIRRWVERGSSVFFTVLGVIALTIAVVGFSSGSWSDV